MCKISLFGHSPLPLLNQLARCLLVFSGNNQEWIYGSILGIYVVIFPKSVAVLIFALLPLLTAAFIMAG